MENLVCPLCSKPLELKQINFTQAVYVCMDLDECPYPIGYQYILVQRSVEELSRPPSKKSKKSKKSNSTEPPTGDDKEANQKQNPDFGLDSIISNALENIDLQPVDPINYSGNESANTHNNNIISDNCKDLIYPCTSNALTASTVLNSNITSTDISYDLMNHNNTAPNSDSYNYKQEHNSNPSYSNITPSSNNFDYRHNEPYVSGNPNLTELGDIFDGLM